MTKKKRGKMEAAIAIQDKDMVVKMNKITTRRFRAICTLEGKKPKEEMERILNEWTEAQLRKAMKEKGADFLLGQNDQ